MKAHIFGAVVLMVAMAAAGQENKAATEPAGTDSRTFMALHEIPWAVDGKPILGTYGAERLEDLERVRDAGMNVVLSSAKLLDTNTPEGAFCRENGIKALPHVTSYIYHGIRLREPITAEQKNIPLFFASGRSEQGSHVIQIDEERIRYEEMTETELVNCERGVEGTSPAAHREGIILFWPEACKAEIEKIKDSPNLFGYYVLDDSPGDAVSALRAMNSVIRQVDPNPKHPVCAGFGDAGSIINLAPGVCDIMFIYWYPVSTNNNYDRLRTSREVQHMLAAARKRVPGIPFAGIYQAFDGAPAKTGQGVPTPEQLREQLEDFVREGASGLVSFICYAGPTLPGWADLGGLGGTIKQAMQEIRGTGGLMVRAEPAAMRENRIQPAGYWVDPVPVPGAVPAWYIAAAFDDTEGKGLDAAFPPDEAIDLKALYPVKTGMAGWRVRETTAGVLGLSEIYDRPKNGVAYAFCDVTSPREQKVQMRLCSDDDAWVRLNGKEVYRSETGGGLDYDKDVVPLVLPRGTSRIVMKIYNRAGMWGFYMRFTDEAGRPLEGLEFSPQGS